MRQVEWIDLVRLLALLGMAYGARQAWKALPAPVVHDGRRYRRGPDGVWRGFWGGRVRDAAVLAALDAKVAAAVPENPHAA